MIQEIILFSIFAVALFYLGRLVYRSFTTKESCPKGCGSCGAVDFNKIQQQIKAKQKSESYTHA